MKKDEKGIIISATKEELRQLYAERAWSEIMDLDEFFSCVQQQGILIECEPVNVKSNLEVLLSRSPYEVAVFLTHSLPYMPEFKNTYSVPAESISVWENWLNAPYTQFLHETLYTMAQSNCRNDSGIPATSDKVLVGGEPKLDCIVLQSNLDKQILTPLMESMNDTYSTFKVGTCVKYKGSVIQLREFLMEHGYTRTDAIKWAAVIAASPMLEVIGTQNMEFDGEQQPCVSVLTTDGFLFCFPESHLEGTGYGVL